jgi:hypothetical protein
VHFRAEISKREVVSYQQIENYTPSLDFEFETGPEARLKAAGHQQLCKMREWLERGKRGMGTSAAAIRFQGRPRHVAQRPMQVTPHSQALQEGGDNSMPSRFGFTFRCFLIERACPRFRQKAEINFQYVNRNPACIAYLLSVNLPHKSPEAR